MRCRSISQISVIKEAAFESRGKGGGGKGEVMGKRKIYDIAAFTIATSHQRLLHRVENVIFEDFALSCPYLTFPYLLSLALKV